VSSKVLEGILGKLEISYKKAAPKNGPVIYDFDRQGYKIRLSNFGGTDLMLDAAFEPVPVERINAWNVRAKFSRGVLYGGGKPYAAIESNLDCEGGVTSGAIVQFIRRFDSEVSTFDKFLADRGSTAAGATAGPGMETVHSGVSSALLEKILKDLKITYRKSTLKNGAGIAYDYERNSVPVRLIDFGGKDVMLSAEFRKATLAEINEFNLQRTFIRAVLYKDGGRAYTALERNLDVEGGVTENILRNLITGFDADIQEFTRFLGKTDQRPERGASAP
jgi:hypothetical protein